MAAQRYEIWRREIENKFAKKSLVEDSIKTYISPSGKFSLEASVYSSGPCTWNYSRGIVRRVSDRHIIADVKRNYVSFWHAWVPHQNGNEYLLCGEDYQGYNIIELTSGRNQLHFPEEAFDGQGFCWAGADVSPDGLTLAVIGCYWANQDELVFFDFTDPASIPLKELARIRDFDGPEGWKTNDSFAYTQSEESGREPATWERKHVTREP